MPKEISFHSSTKHKKLISTRQNSVSHSRSPFSLMSNIHLIGMQPGRIGSYPWDPTQVVSMVHMIMTNNVATLDPS